MADSNLLPAHLPEATTGFEPVIAVLQTAAFPLGYVARSIRFTIADLRLLLKEGICLPKLQVVNRKS
jgi:hypothetical protein